MIAIDTNVLVRLVTNDCKLEWQDDPWDDVVRAGAWLLDLESEFGPDLVHLNGYAHGALPFGAPKVVVAHSCVLSWWRAVLGAEAPASWNRYRTALRKGVGTANLVIAPSRTILADLERECGPLPTARVSGLTYLRAGLGAGAADRGPCRCWVPRRRGRRIFR